MSTNAVKSQTNRAVAFVPGTAALLVITIAVVYFIRMPSFWLDEAYVALAVQEPGFSDIFSRMERGHYFPRVYLLMIAGIRNFFGYQFWVLRLLPTLFFIGGTVVWARVLATRTKGSIVAAAFAAFLLLGSNFWLEQAIQVKQYSLDVLVALLPFLIRDSLLDESLLNGRRRLLPVLLALPCFLSYSYPLALGGRIIGWFLVSLRSGRWRVNVISASLLLVPSLIGFGLLIAIDYRQGADLSGYWSHCDLRKAIGRGPIDVLRLLGDLFFGWYPGRFKLLVASAVGLLMTVGIWRVISRFRRGEIVNDEWGSRSVSSLAVLFFLLLAGLMIGYPICAGRLTLFAQIQFQIIALEGLLLVLTIRRPTLSISVALAFCLLMGVHSIKRYSDVMGGESDENLRPVLPLIDSTLADNVWVHPCSVLQVKSLLKPLPVSNVIMQTRREMPPPDQKSWIVWTHLGGKDCGRQLQQVKAEAKSWQIIHEGPGRGLALAEF